ncbi:MAG: radical SAM family heme chaperone HemW [Chitinophagaceae bacterium]
MAGIYIHIPFCRQACHYCNFHFSTSLRYKDELIDALLKEIELTPPFTTAAGLPETIGTIYFGGGTPSLCTGTEVERLLQTIRQSFPVSADAEITLEANPDDITDEKLAAWKTAGINRLSIGIQSFFDEDLQWMNRAHNSSQASGSLESAVRLFDNITIDLIYGTPQLTNEKWEHNVRTAIGYGIPHLSCYALTVEPKTPLDKLIRQQQSPDTDPARQSEQFLLLMEWTKEAGYEHYEISNFAKPGFRSRHNSSYWQGKKYYGFGPSAHSFDGEARWWNVANNTRYIQSIQQGIIPLEKEVLTPEQRLNEYIMISLRTSEGLELGRIREFNIKSSTSKVLRQQLGDTVELMLERSRKYIERGLMAMQDDRLVLTNEGRLLADGIAADLFVG